MQSFYRYMKKNHSREDSPGNDLLQDMERDRGFPKDETARWKILRHLNRHGACRECIDTFDEYWLTYAHDEGINITALDCNRYLEDVVDLLSEVRFDGDESDAITNALEMLVKIQDMMEEAV